MSRIADVAQGTVMPCRARSIADAVACTPPFAVCEMLGRQRSERFCTALHTLRGLLGQPVNKVIATTTAPTESENSAHVHGAAAPWTSCHTVAAALVDLQSTLDFVTSKAASTSAAVRSAVVSAAMNVLLDGSRCAHYLEAVSTSVSAAHGLEVMARVMDVMLWVVDAVCSPLAEELREDGLPCPSPGSFTAAVKLWCELARHTDALLRFACDALASTSTGECRWGAPVHAGAVRMLDALLQTCFVLRAFPQSTSANSNIEKLEDAQAAVLAAIQLGSRLASEEVVCCVAAQLQMPVQVLDEVDGFTRQSHEFVHDVLRHGMPPPPPPPPLNCAANRERSPEETGASAVTARTPWMQLDSTRRPLSPVELYTCAVAFISHAAAYGAAFPLRLDGKLSVCVSVWEACVAVLERALQEGETALTAPPSSSSAPVEDGTAPVDPIPSMASTAFLSPLLPRVHAFTGARCEIAALAPQEETVVDSEPVSPCESPVMNTQATTPDRASGPLGGPAATTTATTSAATAEDAGRWRPAGTVTSSRRSMDFPPCPPATTEVETARSACGGEDSMRSNDVTMAGMTDTETASLCAESAVLDVIGRSRPIAIAPAKAISVMTSASQGNTSSTLCGATPSTLVRAARTSSPSSATGSPTHSSVVHRSSATAAAAAASAGGAQGLSTPSPRPSSLRKSAVSPSTAVPAHPRQPSLNDPLRFVSDGSGKSFHHGSSKSSCLQRERPSKPTATTTPTTTAFVCPALTLRRIFPSHPQLTNAVLTSLALLSAPSVCAVEAMMALADTRVLTVLSELMEHPGNTLQGVVMATVENCFAFWEVMLSLRSPFLFPVEAPAVQKCSVEASEALALPVALRACLHTFALFLRWDGESWAAVHAQYVQRALRLLIGVLTSVQKAAPAGGEMRGLCSPRLRRSPAAAPLLAQVVRCLLEHGVIAHIWRCLSMDATQVPGAMGNAANAPSNGKSGGGNNTGMRGGHPVPRVPAAMLDPASYGCFLYGAPPPVSYALLSEAQCTAIHLLYTLANSLSWSSAKLHESPSRPLTDEKGCPVPDVSTYCAFMEESFKHLPACANCLRRCTYTCSQSRPIVPADHEALSRVLNVLRILFGAMGAGATRAVREDDAGNDDDAAAAVAELRQTWAHQIEDSQVLDVLAHIGTAAELVTFTLPRLCIFTLRSYLCHVHHLTNGPLVGDKGSVLPHNPPSASASVTPTRHIPTTAIASTTVVTRARVGMAALQALVVDPPPPPTIAGASTWGRSAVRESLLVILLARMQRRCAGQSATASVPQRLEVFALLIDVLAGVVDSLPTALSDTSRETCQQMYDAATAVELVRVTQRVVAAVLACRVWSGTAQELRYLDPSCTTPVKEALRFSARVAQLVNGSLRALLCVEPTRERGSARSGQRLTVDDSLGKHTASVLLAESTSVTFAFHVVTMDFPLALAGLMNGTRWQVAAAKPAGQPASCTSPNAGGSSSGRSSNSSSSSSRGQASLASPTRRPATVTMAPPRPPPSFLMAREADTNEFTNEDRRETCEVAASALVEILCVLGRVEALVQSATPLHPAVLAALPYRTGAQAAPSTGASGGRAMAAFTAAASSSSSQTDEPRQYDVVVVQNGRADFAGVITSTVYPRAAAALAGPLLVPSSGQFLASATPSPDTEAAAAAATDGAGGPTSSAFTTSPSAEATKEDPLNWRRTESQWRRRLPLLSTSVKDALQALDLEVLDRYLTLRHRRARLFDGAAGSPLSHHGDAESRVAEGAVMCLAAEKKRYLRSI